MNVVDVAAPVVVEIDTLEGLHAIVTELPRMADSLVVVVSSLPAEVTLLPTMAAGARAFLLTPLEADDLERAVASVVAGGLVVDPRCTAWLVELAVHGHRARPSSGLTLRQSQVMALVRSGLMNREIAHVLGVSSETVKSHLHEAMKRLGATDRWGAAVLAHRSGDEHMARTSTTPHDALPGGST